MTFLKVEQVGRRFGGLIALQDVTFNVTPRQIKAVIGPNGAGKTTLFNIISGMQKPDMGRVFFKDQEITRLKSHKIARIGVARTFQNPSLFAQMSVLENVMVGLHCRSRGELLGSCLTLPGQRKEERRIQETALEKLDFVGLTAFAQESAAALAFGQRRMVELARALATGPDLLLLDEPASGLNTKETHDLGELIVKIRDTGVTVLLVEHDMSLVMRISDDILVLHNGRPIAEGAPAEIQNNSEVAAVYLGKGLDHAIADQKS